MKWFYVATASLFVVFLAMRTSGYAQEPGFHVMNPSGCVAYAQDAQRLALMRNGGITQEDVRRVFGTLRLGWYSEAIWPYFSDLVVLTYASSEEPKAWAQLKYQECTKQMGLKRITQS